MSPLISVARPRLRGRSFFRPIVEALEDRTLLASLLPTATANVNFTIGRLVADPVRDLVYVADQTDARVFAVNTDTGTEVASQTLTAEPGALAVSLDDKDLYVAEPGAFQIQVLSLPTLTPVNTINVGMQVDNLVATVNNHLFISTPDQYGDGANSIDEVDAQTGTVLDSLPSEIGSTSLLRTNSTGTQLYVCDDFDGNVEEFDVSGSGKPTETNTYTAPSDLDNDSKDFLVNASAERIYTIEGVLGGVGVTDMASNSSTVWSWPSSDSGFGEAIAALSSGPIYGATDDTIVEYSPSGVIENQYPLQWPVVQGWPSVVPESLKITPNGHLIYAASDGGDPSVSNYQLNVIGLSKLSIPNDSPAIPNPTPTAETEVNFTIGSTIADPTRDLVYVADQTDDRIFAVNTDSGTEVASQTLEGEAGTLTVSLDGNYLYVAEPGAFQIQVLSLPSLAPVNTLNLGLAVNNMVAIGNDHLLVNIPVNSGRSITDEIDAQTGAMLGTLPTASTLPQQQTNPAGNNLNNQGADSFDEYDVSGASLSVMTDGDPYEGGDFFDDESAGRVFTINLTDTYTVAGVGVTDLNSDQTTTWSAYNPFDVNSGPALAALPSGPIYAAIGDDIYEFNINGLILAQYPAPVTAESLKITPNGNLLFADDGDDGNNTSLIGIIGAANIVIPDDPVAVPLPTATDAVNFTIGSRVADPVRDVVYVADQTDERIFAVNTDSGTEVASQSLEGEPGLLAVSVDDNYLYVTEAGTFQIQVLSLPSLAPVNTLNIGFDVDGLVATVNDHLFVSTAGNSGQFAIDEIDAQTGVVLDTLSTQYPDPQLQTNSTGTDLYVDNVDEYDVSGTGQPAKINNYSELEGADLLVDESAGRLYTTDGGGFGVDVTDMNTNATTSWSFGESLMSGSAIAGLPSGPVYAASGDEIFEFGAGGNVLAQFTAPGGLTVSSLEITPNGNLLCGEVTGANASELGIIGLSSLVIADDPTPTSPNLLLPTTVDVNFATGQMVADPVRDIVYVADQTDASVLAVNTDSGSVVASQTLAGEPGALAVSVDDNYLYVAEPGALQVQVLSLPDLTPVNTLNVGFVVDNLVATVNDHLFVSIPEAYGAVAIDEIDGQTGTVLGTLPTQSLNSSLRTNPSGTNLYIQQDTYYNQFSVVEYDVSGSGQPTETNTYSAGSGDFLVDEQAGRIYTASNPFNGSGATMTDMNSNETTIWSFNGPQNSDNSNIAALPSGPVYIALGNEIIEFSAGGVVLAQYATPNGVTANSLVITPNGNLLYGTVTGNNASEVGIIGLSSLVIPDDPAPTSPNLLPTTTVDVNFSIGSMVADPVRDLVYVADQTDARVFAVNTDSGSVVASQTLTTEPGALAVSVDGNYLYVAEPNEFQIQVLSLPDLTPVNTLNIGLEVDSMVATVNDRLFVGISGNSSKSVIDEIDGQTGVVLGTLPTSYTRPQLMTNPSGTNLYIDGEGEYPGNLDEYDVSGAGQPAMTNAYPVADGASFLVDESAARVYTADGSVTDMNTSATTSWSFSSPNGNATGSGSAIAALPSSPIYIALGDEIFEFSAGGIILAQYAAPKGVMADSLIITPNGNLLYGKVTGNNTSELGIIGVSNLAIADDPVPTSPLPTTTAGVNFTIGSMVADPARDLVYVADQTDARVLAVNTDSGSEVASQSLAGEPGALAISLDDNYLYVAEAGGFQIQVLSLPDLTQVNTINVGMEVDDLVATANDHLFVSTPSESGNNAIEEIDAQTGAVLNTLAEQYVTPQLETNPAGTNLYIEGANGPDVDEYDVSGSGQPAMTNSYQNEGGDFLVDESAARVYTADGSVTDMNTNAMASWSLGGSVIAALPSGPIYAASGDEIYEFSLGGLVLAKYAAPEGSMVSSLVITPNGNLLYGYVNGDFTSELGIIGASSLDIVDDPVTPSPSPTAIDDVNFAVGSMVADPVRDLVYVADLTDSCVLAVNTDLGRTVAIQPLAGVPGAMAVSVEGDRLFVAESGAFQIEVLSLPTLTPIMTLHVGFEVDNLVATANDDLFVSTPTQFLNNAIDEINSQTGAMLGTLPTQYAYPLLRTNPAGTHLYVQDESEGNIDEYNVSGAGLPARTNSYSAQTGDDFLVDETAGRLYSTSTAGSGISVTDANTNAMTTWSFTSPFDGGSALAALPTSLIYSASGDGIDEFGAGGNVLAQYPDPAGVMADSLQITPNGNLLFGNVTGNNTSEFGIIGLSSLAIADDPVANFTVAVGSGGRISFNAKASVPGTEEKHQTLIHYAWNFGDGTTGSGVAITHKFAGAGPFTVTLTVTSSAGQTGTLSVPVLGGSISGTIYNDVNGNGSRDSGEPALAEWPVFLDAEINGQFVPDVEITSTSAVGKYVFTGLQEGVTYRVRELAAFGWQTTTPSEIDVTVKSNRTVTGQNFGNAQLTAISGKVYDEVSSKVAGSPLKGWLVYLYATKNGKIVASSGEVTATAADGSYEFTGLKPGVTYQVSIVAPIGWKATTLSQIDVTAVADTNETANDFGFAPAASTGGNVFYSLNADGTEDDGEGLFALRSHPGN